MAFKHRLECRAKLKPNFKEKMFFLFASEVTFGFDIDSAVEIVDYKLSASMNSVSYWDKIKAFFRKRKTIKKITNEIDLKEVDLDKIEEYFKLNEHKK